MIARCSLLVCAFAFCCDALPTAATEDDPEIFIYSVPLSKESELVWAIKRSRLMAIHPWREGAEEAPLSPNKAVAIANDYLQRQLGVHGASVLWIHMRHIANEGDNRWMYDIDYSTDPPLISEDPRLHVTVAMDGKVIIPEKRPRTEHIKSSNQPMQPTPGRRTVWLHSMETRPMQITLALASSG
jgi:hypothetical protein